MTLDLDEDNGIADEPWCSDYDAHAPAHRFCSDHQAAWCRVCDGMCPECVDDPHCPDCHCQLFEEYHDWDCSYADDDDDDDA